VSQEIPREDFSEEDYARFGERLEESLEAMATVLARPGFGVGPTTLGAELEVAVIDEVGRPLPVNRAVLAGALDPRIALEIDRFNLEINTRPVPLAGRAFGALAAELSDALAAIDRAAAAHGGRSVAIGILPTLVTSDLQPGMLTDSHRYRALSAAIRRLRPEPFRIRIDGDDPLDVECDDVTFEGANTSLQVHLRVTPETPSPPPITQRRSRRLRCWRPRACSPPRRPTQKSDRRDAFELGVHHAVIPKPGFRSRERLAFEQQRWFRRGRAWGSGGEARIARLKHCFGLARARYRGDPGMVRTIYWAAIANNLLAIAARAA
jgi:hypothetical protein